MLREHVEDENKLPILIFPEGTCINNTSVMLFKKGSFEVGKEGEGGMDGIQWFFDDKSFLNDHFFLNSIFYA